MVRVLHHNNGEMAFWLSVCYEFLLEMHRCQAAITSQANKAKAAKLASLNRLQRSLVSDRIAAVAKDSTVKVSKFLSKMLQAMKTFIQINLKTAQGWQVS